jgi:hypothetical protein
MSQPQGHSAAGRTRKIKKKKMTIGIRTRDLQHTKKSTPLLITASTPAVIGYENVEQEMLTEAQEPMTCGHKGTSPI